MKKYKLKKKYKNILIYCGSVVSVVALLFGIFLLYQARYNQINGQRPESIQIKK